MNSDRIPFEIEAQKVVQLLAKQIYQSPLALLRENTQNAFDAIRQRMHKGKPFDARIEISLSPKEVSIRDNGVGMTPDDLRQHYWTAGSSSKNTEAARSAGVVGTFGIGAMANFGIADRLTVETESLETGQRTVCRAEKSKLSLKDECIEREFLPSLGLPGTIVTAQVDDHSVVDVEKATAYIRDFVFLVDVPVLVNGKLVSQCTPESSVVPVPEAFREECRSAKVGARLQADTTLIVSNNAEVWIKLTNLQWSGRQLSGRLVFRTGVSSIQTFRSGFGLATAAATSVYQFGGIADLPVLEPTAGREAITVDGLQLLQVMVAEIDDYVSTRLAVRDECDSSSPFMNWVVSKNRFDLCERLRIGVSPGEKLTLGEVKSRSVSQPMMLYDGTDQGVIRMHSSDDTPVLLLARNNPRRRCEQKFLSLYAKTSAIADAPIVQNRRRMGQMNSTESAVAFRVQSIVEADYLLECDIEFGTISHGLPAVAEKTTGGVRVTLNPDGQTVKLMMGLYATEYAAFGSMVKDFVRNIVFPRIADFVPSSTRQGAEAFLKAIRRPRELFEYADDDLGSLPRIWEDYSDGLITMEQAVERSKAAVRSSVQVVENAEDVHSVVPDVIQNEHALQNENELSLNLEACPAITRLETMTNAKLLVIGDDEAALRGYRCFLAITEKVRDEMGEFFLQPHRTSIVWGGQKTLFIFLHHSGQFGLYYDLQTREQVDALAGGGPFATATIVLRDRIFIPIPDAIKTSFVPAQGERKRFEVRGDILRTEE